MRRLLPLLLLAATTATSTSNAGVVAGHIALARSGAPEGSLRAAAGVGDAVVWVAAIPANVERKLAGGGGWWIFKRKLDNRPHRLVQAEQRFKPRVLATVAGQSVEFRNLDRVYHNAFSSSAARRFDLGKYAPGQADTLEFPRAGIVNVLCDIHPRELAYVVVVPNHAFTRPDSLGRFTLPRLPAGTYSVHAWHPRRGEVEHSVVVPRSGDVRLDFDL